MAKLKVQGNASGTGVVTLTAPNTNTDRTITLPDGDISLGVGIDDNATSTAITIDASENVGIGAAPAYLLDVHSTATSGTTVTANISNAKYGVPTGYTALQIGTEYDDGSSRIVSRNNTTNQSELTLQTHAGTSGVFTDALVISSAGRVTMPNQPFGAASISQAVVGTGVKGFYSPYSISRGGLSVDNTNGRFTVPVAGAYLVGHHNLGDSTSGSLSVQIRVNGTVSNGGYTQETNSSNDNLSQQLIIQLSANDYVDFNASTGAFHNNQNYSRFYICLLG
jgi:hypothetical protein